MHSNTTRTPTHPGDVLSRIFKTDRDARALSVRSGISEVTLRQIVSSGQVGSYVTAVALEIATNNEIEADAITDLSTKGARLYRREPARSLLKLSLMEGMSMARLLGRYDLTNADLFVFMNAAEGHSEDTKDRVRSVLGQLGISTIRNEPFPLAEAGGLTEPEEP